MDDRAGIEFPTFMDMFRSSSVLLSPASMTQTCLVARSFPEESSTKPEAEGIWQKGAQGRQDVFDMAPTS
jgi:hypothetical protein